MNEKDLKDYEWIWKYPNCFVLILKRNIYGDEHPSADEYQIMQRGPFIYRSIRLGQNIDKQLVEKLLQAGVKIIDKEPEPASLDVLWGERKNEFALIPNPPSPFIWAIYHKPSQRVCTLPVDKQEWLEICQKMMDVGVEILDELPSKPIC